MEEGCSKKSVVSALERKGWCFRDGDHVISLIEGMILAGKDELSALDVIQSELVNIDLRTMGGKSLPASHVIEKASYLRGPKILQVVSARDISRSSIEASFKSSPNRLLRFCLTDGHSEIVAIEYAFIPSICEEIIPGTKVCLKGRCPVHNGILCLDSDRIDILGGVVQTLYQEWEMMHKYSGLMRTSFRISQMNNASDPPPFEKLQVGAPNQQLGLYAKSSSISLS